MFGRPARPAETTPADGSRRLVKQRANKRISRVSRVFLDKLIKSQSLPCKRIGTRSYRFKKADLDDWLRSQQ
ncbi:DNA-binding protein [Limosilactobacillus fermentum]|nr:DNA-binding protein [Limosilactobacillus fermentum]